jgi:mRNA interferase RelE/StbE
MAEYKLLFKRSVTKDLRGVPKKDLKRILVRIRSLASDPRPAGCEKLTETGCYRIRRGLYRIIYTVKDEEVCIVIIRVAKRGAAYRGSFES